MSFDAFASSASGPATSSEPVSTPEPQVPASQPAPAAPSATTEPQTQAPTEPSTPLAQPEWSPNFKFKVHDVEHEMDEYFRQFVKSQDDEKKFRELYEKAFGLDVIKPKYQATREKLQQVEPQLQSVMGQIGELRDFYTRGDFDTFFKRLQIPEEKVLQWVIDKAKYQQLPPEQRKAQDEYRSAQERAVSLERENQALRAKYEADQAQARAYGLQVELEKPDVQQLAMRFDAKKGTPGAFRQEVINYADYVWHSSQGRIDLTPDQAVQAVVERLTLFGSPNSDQQPRVIPQQQGVSPAAPRSPKPIPNLSGRNSSSVGREKPKSLADLKKLAASFE